MTAVGGCSSLRTAAEEVNEKLDSLACDMFAGKITRITKSEISRRIFDAWEKFYPEYMFIKTLTPFEIATESRINNAMDFRDRLILEMECQRDKREKKTQRVFSKL